MDIKRSGSQPSDKGPAEFFTGNVRIDPLFQTTEPARTLGVSVTFEPGARTAWHTQELTNGAGADAVLECVGTHESMMQAIHSARPGASVGYVGVPHGVELDMHDLFFDHVRLFGGPAPVRRYLPELIDLVWKRKINPGKVFDLTLPLDQVAEGYRAMDERRAIKTLLRP